MIEKGQVSVFIIIGIVLLLTVGGAYVTFDILSQEESRQNQDTFIADTVSSEFTTVKLFVDECLQKTSEDALVLIGSQGGHIDLSDMRFNNLNPTEADGLNVFGSSQPVPYWYYLQSRNDCESACRFASLYPPLEGQSSYSIEQQLNHHVEREMYRCLNNFAVLRDAGFIIVPNGTLNVSTIFTEDDVKFVARYPLILSINEKSQNIERFVISVDVPFKRMYEYASILLYTQIGSDENGQQLPIGRYLEKQMMEIIAQFVGLDANKLPPFGGSTYEAYSTLFWIKPVVKEQLQGLMQTYIPYLRVANAKNGQVRLGSALNGSSLTAAQKVEKRFIENFVLPIAKKDKFVSGEMPLKSGNTESTVKTLTVQPHVDERFGSFDVNFDYLNWPIYFDTNHEGAIIRPSTITIGVLPGFGLQKFSTYYDLSYPVLVTIFDEKALSERGFTLRFGLESNIRENEAMMPEYTRQRAIVDVTGGAQSAVDYIESAVMEQQEEKTQDERQVYVEALADANVPIPNLEPTQGSLFRGANRDLQETFLCNPDQLNSQLVNATVINNWTKEPVSEVLLNYRCGEETCVIGKTGVDGRYVGKFPLCQGGTLVGIKNGYAQKTTNLSTSLENEKTVELSIDKKHLIEVDIEVMRQKKYQVTKIEGRRTVSTTEWKLESPNNLYPGDGEIGYVLMERVDNAGDEMAIPQYVYINASNRDNTQVSLSPTITTVELTPGVYRMTGMVMGYSDLTIQPDRRKADDEVYYVPKTSFTQNPYIAGNIELSEKTQFVTIKPEDLYVSKKLIVRGVGADMKHSTVKIVIEDMSVQSNYTIKIIENIDKMIEFKPVDP